MECFTSSTPSLAKRMIEKMSLVPFNRMHRTCREIYEFMEGELNQFNIPSDKKLVFDLIDDDDRRKKCHTPISVDHNIHLSIKPGEFYRTFNSLNATSVIKEFSFVRFNEIEFGVRVKEDGIPWYEDQFKQILASLEANKMKANIVTTLGPRLAEDAIRVLEPKKVICFVRRGRVIKPRSPKLWRSLDKIIIEGGDASNFLNDVAPHCRKVILKVPQQWDSNVFKNFVQKVLQGSVYNKSFTVRFGFDPVMLRYFLDLLLQFPICYATHMDSYSITELCMIPTNFDANAILIPLKNNTTDYLVIFTESQRGRLCHLQCFVTSNWKDITKKRDLYKEMKIISCFNRCDVMEMMKYFYQDSGIQLPIGNTEQSRFTAAIPLDITLKILKQMDLTSFNRMSRTCRMIHSLMECSWKEFNIPCEKELNIEVISDSSRFCTIDDEDTIPHDYSIQLHVFPTDLCFIQKCPLSSLHLFLEKYSFIKFSKLTLSICDELDIFPFGKKEVCSILKALKFNKMTMDTVILVNTTVIEKTIEILKPKKLYCYVKYEKSIWPKKLNLWSSLDELTLDNCNVDNIMSAVIPLCKKVEIRPVVNLFSQECPAFVRLLEKVLTSNCLNTEFDSHFFIPSGDIINSVTAFDHLKIEKMISNHLDAVYALPMMKKMPACLIVFISSRYAENCCTTRVQYFLAHTWYDIINRKMPSLSHPNVEITKIFQEINIKKLMSFVLAEITKNRPSSH